VHLFKRSKNLGYLIIDVNVTASKIMELFDEFADNSIYISISNLHNDIELVKFFKKNDILANNVRGQDLYFQIHKKFFQIMSELFLSLDSEVICLFLKPEKELDARIFNSFNMQKDAIILGFDSLVCTWVTEDDRLFFHYNKEKCGIEMIEKIKRFGKRQTNKPI
jgi:hypothetical protein